MRSSLCALLLILGPLLRVDVAAADVAGGTAPYELETGRELALLLGGGVILGGAFLLQRNLQPFDAQEVEQIEGTGLHAGFLGLDGAARRRWSPAANHASDVTLRLTQIAPLVQAFVEGDRSGSTGTLLLMYGETVLLTSAVNQMVKVLVHRTRPFVYNPDPSIPIELKESLDARRSFPSGHAAASFAAAVHFAMVYDRTSSNQSSGVVWGASLGLASLTGYLRYAAGKHHPIDIIAGAALGSLVGWLIPTLHETDESSPQVDSPMLTFGFGF